MIRESEWDALQEMVETLWAQQGSVKGGSSAQAGRLSALHYLQQTIGFHHLKALRFESARKALLSGQAPLLPFLRLFTDLAGDLLPSASSSTTKVPAGLAGEYEQLSTLAELIQQNLSSNYAPALDAHSDPSLSHLSEVLAERAEEQFLLGLLAQVHAEGPSSAAARQCPIGIVDTLLARLYARHDRLGNLRALLSRPNECDLQVLRPVLEEKEQHGVLADLARREGRFADYLVIATRLLDGDVKDDRWHGSVADVIEAVQQCGDAALTTKYGIWIASKDPEAGLRILTKRKSARSSREGGVAPPTTTLAEHRSILHQLQEAGSPATADAYLEHVALARRNQYPELVAELYDQLFAVIKRGLAKEDDEQAMRQAERDFQEGHYAESFLGHLALLAPHSPPLFLARIKLALLLQGASELSNETALAGMRDAGLKLEQAIVLGKLHRHEHALAILALEMKDANSAEAYCNQEGEVVSPVLAERVLALTENASLKAYVAFTTRARKNAQTAQPSKQRKSDLLKLLLRVYVNAEQR